MTRVVTPSRLILILFTLIIVGAAAFAQRPPNVGRPGRPQGQFPAGQRGLGRGPLGNPQLGRPRGQLRSPEGRRRMQQQLMQAIGITNEQRSRMDTIRRSHEDEVISAGRRLREARRAFDRVIMNEQYDEASINRHADELAAAQADMIRLQARIRGQVRSVLSPEQVMRFNELERRLRRQQREQQDRQREMIPGEQNPRPPVGPGATPTPDLISLLLDLP